MFDVNALDYTNGAIVVFLCSNEFHSQMPSGKSIHTSAIAQAFDKNVVVAMPSALLK